MALSSFFAEENNSNKSGSRIFLPRRERNIHLLRESNSDRWITRRMLSLWASRPRLQLKLYHKAWPGPASSEGERPHWNPAIQVHFTHRVGGIYFVQKIMQTRFLNFLLVTKMINYAIYWRKNKADFNTPLIKRKGSSKNRSNDACLDTMTPYKSTTQLYNYNYYIKPTLQPGDVIASSSPASTWVANPNDGEQCHSPRKRLKIRRPLHRGVKDREEISKGYRRVHMHERWLCFLK